MNLYERLLEKRVDEERRRGGTLPRMRGPGSKILARRLDSASERRPEYVADLSMMYRLMKRSPRNAEDGMRQRSLKAKYREEYGELRAKQGQQELL